MIPETSSFFSNIKIEDGMQVIDLEEDVEKYDLLSRMFHKESVVLDTKDLVLPLKNDKRRYFEDTTVCYKCGELGHVSRDCIQENNKNCMYCDLNHRGKPCDFIFCDNCQRLGHFYKACREKKYKPTVCLECPLQYHYSDECPRVWRKYRLVNENVKNEFMASCPLCFSRDHFLDDCEYQERRMTIFTKDYLEILGKNRKKQEPSKKYRKN